MNKTPFSAHLLAKLRPHQVEPANHLLGVIRRFRSGVDLSKTGTGKTYVAAAIAAELKQPFLVVVPKVAQTQWKRAGEHFGESFSIVGWEMLRTGGTPYGKWENGSPPPGDSRRFFKCTKCQCVVDLDPRRFYPCFAHHLGIHCLDTKTRPHHYGKFSFHSAVRGVIFDEIHRAGHDSLNSDMVIAAKRQGLLTLGLSATPAQSPLNMRALGYLLDLHRLINFESWVSHYGCRRIPRCGLKFLVSKAEQIRIMLQIRASIIPDRGIMVDTKNIPGFPVCDIRAELFDLPEKDSEELTALYNEMSAALAGLEARQKLDKAPESPLTATLRQRQRIELLKVPLAAELGADKLEQGFSVCWFVNFRQTIDELKKRFPDAGVIDGTTTRDRQATVDRFQANDINKLVINCEAGGACLSLQDLDGLHPRAGFVFPNFSATSMQQVFGRLPRVDGLTPVSYVVLFAAGTPDVNLHRAISQKLNNMEALTDGDLDPRNLLFENQ
jgi:Type III restriction enzyme, res subunit